MKNDKVVARLDIVVEFEELPDTSDIERILDEAKAYGAVAKAELTIHKTITKTFK